MVTEINYPTKTGTPEPLVRKAC